MDSSSNTTQASGGQLSAFAGAQGVRVNDLNFTQAQNVHYHSTRPLDLSQVLKPLHDASHMRDRVTSPPDSQCLAGTRRDVLERLGSWMKDGKISRPPAPRQGESQVAKPICWMYGFVGCGKSAIAQTMAEEYARSGKLAASFFFFQGAGSRGTVNGFVTTLAYQIAMNVPGASKFIEGALSRDPGVIHSSRSLQFQLRDLVYQPLYRCMTEKGDSAAGEDPYLIVIDGMDECENKQEITSFIVHSIEFFREHPRIPLRLFMTSRVEEHIRTHIGGGAAVVHLFDLPTRSNQGDVERAMRATLEHAKAHDRALQALGPLWPPKDDLDSLVTYCDGSFIFMSTIAKFILWGSGDDDPRTPEDRLKLALTINLGIDSVYQNVLSRAHRFPHFLAIISTVAYLQTPLSISAIAALLGLSTYQVIRVLVTLQAILQVPGQDDEPVTFFHTSLRDFLTDPTRSGEFHALPSHHAHLTHRCLDILVGAEPTANSECCTYAMLYWSAHLKIGARWDDLLNLDHVLDNEHPYNPIDRGDWTERSSQRRRGEGRPIVFTLLQPQFATMFQNLEASFPLSSEQSSIKAYCYSSLSPTRWSYRRDGVNGLISLTSLHVSSLGDIIQGLRVLEYEGNRAYYNLELVLRRGQGVHVIVKTTWVSPRDPSEGDRWEITIEDRLEAS